MNFLCFDIGGTKLKYGLLNNDYLILEKKEKDSNAYLGGAHILKLILEIIAEHKNTELAGIAISTAGVVDHLSGKIIYANDIIPDYTGLDLKHEINKKTKLPVSVENDVNCFALSHILDTNEDFLMVTIGTGIGGAIVINQEIYHGKNNSAGEFGQMLLGNKKFEVKASITALINKANEYGLNVKNGLEVFALYDNYNQLASKAVNYFYKNLSIGLINLSYIFNVSKIILGGGITNRKDFLKELNLRIFKIADQAYFKSQIEVSKSTSDGGMIGALVHLKTQYKFNKS